MRLESPLLNERDVADAGDDDARDSTVFFLPPFVPLFATAELLQEKERDAPGRSTVAD